MTEIVDKTLHGIHKQGVKYILENGDLVKDQNGDSCIFSHNVHFVCDSAWSSFVTKLEYKAEWYGKTILRIGTFEPSSKLCNVCGYHNKELTLAVREWTCPSCSTFHDRDINAAINIKKFALQDQNLVGV